jgi:hypothetical protein
MDISKELDEFGSAVNAWNDITIDTLDEKDMGFSVLRIVVAGRALLSAIAKDQTSQVDIERLPSSAHVDKFALVYAKFLLHRQDDSDVLTAAMNLVAHS